MDAQSADESSVADTPDETPPFDANTTGEASSSPDSTGEVSSGAAATGGVSTAEATGSAPTSTAERADATPTDDPTDDPLVSVVVPTYGRPRYLSDALLSVAEQTHDEVQLLVVDDHSPDPVAPVVEGLDLDLRDVRCLRHDRNRGANAARNTGIEAADGALVAFLDDDDRWTPTYLERAVGAFDDPEVGLVTAGARVVDGAGSERGVYRPDFSADPMDDLLDGELVGSFSRFVVRRSALDRAGPLDEELPSWQDWDLQFRLAREWRFASIPEPLVVRRAGDHDQLTDDFEKRRNVSYPRLLARHRGAIARRGRDDERRFVSVLSRSLAASALQDGRYPSAVRYLLRALRHDPRARETYLYLAAALGGPLTYGPLKRLKRTMRRFAA